MLTNVSQKVTDFFTAYPLRVFDKHQIIAWSEEPMPGVFYLVDGRVSQYDITPSGNEVIVNMFKPHAFFPISTALNQTPNHYFFEAATKTSARVAPLNDAVQFLNDNPDVMLDLLARVYKGVDGVLRRMAHLMGGTAKSRLLFELLTTAYRFGETQKDGSVYIPLAEGELAKMSGLARETVNRGIQSLKAAGLLDITPNGMTVSDMKRLESMLGTEV